MTGESGFLDNYTHEHDVWSPNYYMYAEPQSGIVIHHMAGTDFYAAGRRFKDSNQQASAHYSVGDGIWCQHVSENDGAWHAGADWPNRHTIGIENVNSAYGEPWPVSDETFSTCAALMADIAYRHGWDKLERGVNVWGHRDFSATVCPGSLYDRLDELCELANDILGGNTMNWNDTFGPEEVPAWQLLYWGWKHASTATDKCDQILEELKNLEIEGGVVDYERIRDEVKDVQKSLKLIAE